MPQWSETPIFTGRNEVVAKVMFLLVSVIVFTGGGSTSVHAGIPARIPPPEADSGIRSMSGRYASYWNAFLLHGGFVIRQFSGHLFDQACSTGEKLQPSNLSSLHDVLRRKVWQCSCIKASLHVRLPCPCLSPSKFNIVPMETDRLIGRLDTENILSIKQSVTIHTM